MKSLTKDEIRAMRNWACHEGGQEEIVDLCQLALRGPLALRGRMTPATALAELEIFLASIPAAERVSLAETEDVAVVWVHSSASEVVAHVVLDFDRNDELRARVTYYDEPPRQVLAAVARFFRR